MELSNRAGRYAQHGLPLLFWTPSDSGRPAAPLQPHTPLAGCRFPFKIVEAALRERHHRRVLALVGVDAQDLLEARKCRCPAAALGLLVGGHVDGVVLNALPSLAVVALADLETHRGLLAVKVADARIPGG